MAETRQTDQGFVPDNDRQAERGHICLGLLAHVDAGKTTLSEAVLCRAGVIRSRGRVDRGDTTLDTDEIEKRRGITVFSRPAEFSYGGRGMTLLDTPGHADFSPEMERTLQVLDCAVLLISAADGVTGQTRTLWQLLRHYHVPTFLFCNKMDQQGADRKKLLAELSAKLSEHCVVFPAEPENEEQQEEIAVCDDNLLEKYLEDAAPVSEAEIARLIGREKLFPVYFGSALRDQGTEELLEGIAKYARPLREGGKEFGARVFKISHEEKGTRLTWVRVTGGTLRVKEIVSGVDRRTQEATSEKVDQIRIYTGDRFEQAPEVSAGEVCALTGLAESWTGEGLDAERGGESGLLQPLYSRQILFPVGEDRTRVLQSLRVLEEEEPMLQISEDGRQDDAADGEQHSGMMESGIYVQVMGEVQTEILRDLMQRRYGISLSFGPENIVYRETIAEPVEGVGHFEPLRHYAEVCLLLEPGERGSGVRFGTACSTDDLDRNWQRLVLSSLQERPIRGVLTGSDLTDVRITLIGGRAHEKHTEGGDFREAAWRAVRQGLMSAKSVLLEPICSYRAELPQDVVGRFLNDIQQKGGTTSPVDVEGDAAVVTGQVPAAAIGDYPTGFSSYTRGAGRFSFRLLDYAPASNAESVILERAYDPDADREYPSSSVFCSHGAGTVVPWDHVREYMHVHTDWSKDAGETEENAENAFSPDWQKKQRLTKKTWKEEQQEYGAAEDELRQIFEKTYGPVKSRVAQQEEPPYHDADVFRGEKNPSLKEYRKKGADRGKRQKYLLVDGYNVIFSWPKLRELASDNMDSARDALIDILDDYQGAREGTLILVFDAYKVRGGTREISRRNKIYVVFTREAETADAYIEKTVHEIGHRHDVTVVSSDGLEQVIILGEGARRVSSREFESIVAEERKNVLETGASGGTSGRKRFLFDGITEDVRVELEKKQQG